MKHVLSLDEALVQLLLDFVLKRTNHQNLHENKNEKSMSTIGPLHDPVTWHGINYTGTQMTQWDFQNKGKSGRTGTSSFVLEVPLRHLRPSVIYSVPCDRIVQRAYYTENLTISLFNSLLLFLKTLFRNRK